MWEPVGPLAPSVYWRRRSVAFGVVVLVLGGFVWGLAGLAGGDPDPATVEARARAAAMQGSAPPETPAAAGTPGTPDAAGTPPGTEGTPPGTGGTPPGTPGAPQGAPPDGTGPIAAALPSVRPPGDAPGVAPGDAPGVAPGAVPGAVPGAAPGAVPPPAPGDALLVPPGGGNLRSFLPPGVPTGSAGPLLETPSATAPPADPPTAPPAAAAPTAAAPSAAAPSAAAPSAAAPTTAQPQESEPPPEVCADGDIRVTARTDAPSYAPGRKPVLSLVVTNTGDAPCVRDLDAAKQAVAVVKKVGDGLWGSNDCSPGDTDDVRTLAPGEEAVFSVTWSGRTSTPGCTGERTTVPPGSYQLLARLDGIISDPAPFTLEG